MKKLLAGAFVVLAAPALLITPAGAAVPKSKATGTLACGPKTARVWVSFKRLAAENPCGRWLVILLSNGSESDSDSTIVNVAPGAQFHWRGDYTRSDSIEDHVNWWLVDAPWCGGQSVLRGSHGRPVPSPDCE